MTNKIVDLILSFFPWQIIFQDTWTISKSMQDFSQTFLQNLNCEKWRKSLQAHLKSPFANVRNCWISTYNETHKHTHLLYKTLGRVHYPGWESQFQLMRSFSKLDLHWPKFTPLQKRDSPPKSPIFYIKFSKKLWLLFWSWSLPVPFVWTLPSYVTSNGFNPPNLPTTCLKLPSLNPRY